MHEQLVGAGAEVIACVSVNDPFVMDAWGQAQQTEGKVEMLADTCCAFTEAMGMVLDGAVQALGNLRSKRYMAIIHNGQISSIVVDESGISDTSAAAALEKLNALRG